MVYSANCEYDTPELSRLGIRLILVTLGADGANYLNVGNCSVILYSFFPHFLCACTKIKNMLTYPLLSVEMRFIIIIQKVGNVSSFPKNNLGGKT